jgi:hypothetical protein
MFKKTKKLKITYAPKEDITSYELALILKLTFRFADMERLLAEMPPECKRHLKITQTG